MGQEWRCKELDGHAKHFPSWHCTAGEQDRMEGVCSQQVVVRFETHMCIHVKGAMCTHDNSVCIES